MPTVETCLGGSTTCGGPVCGFYDAQSSSKNAKDLLGVVPTLGNIDGEDLN